MAAGRGGAGLALPSPAPSDCEGKGPGCLGLWLWWCHPVSGHFCPSVALVRRRRTPEKQHHANAPVKHQQSGFMRTRRTPFLVVLEQFSRRFCSGSHLII